MFMTIESINPHRPSDVVEEFEPAGPEGADRAVGRAVDGLAEWRGATAHARGRSMGDVASDLEREAEDLAGLMVREVGKPVTEARAELARAVAIWRYYAQLILAADGETYPASAEHQWLLVRRHPIGVCALITPWNFPVAIPSWKAAPAIGYGNAIVLKPAPAATAVAERLVEVANRHLPSGVWELVRGNAETGEPLLDHRDVAAVSFTGSVPVGRAVARRVAGRGARVQCEMGGQNPSIVLADADLDNAAATIAYAAMGYAGQKCTATSRVIVQESSYPEFRDRLVSAVEDLGVTDPESEGCLVGPMIAGEARTGALEALQKGGGTILTGGEALDHEGFYLAPTLVELDDPSSLLAKEEVFAPVAVLLKSRSIDEAIRVANEVKYGLVAAIFTKDIRGAMDFADRVEAGLIRVNAPTSGVDYHAPFGGTKASSIGPREQGLAAREFYTETRTLLVNT
jgi:acyl-CoA reductase-like NAD-dependent aldehyde dehydrogenase